MVVVALRGPRIRAPPNVIATLIRRQFNGLRGPPVVGTPNSTNKGIDAFFISFEADDTNASKDVVSFKEMAVNHLGAKFRKHLQIKSTSRTPGFEVCDLIHNDIYKRLSGREGGRSLILLHYAGHGWVNNDMQLRCCALPDRKQAFPFCLIKDKLIVLKGDWETTMAAKTAVLVLLDCCYAGTAFRGGPESSRTAEIIAACDEVSSTKARTSAVSFTQKVAGAVGQLLRTDGRVNFAMVCSKILQQNPPVRPVHKMLAGWVPIIFRGPKNAITPVENVRPAASGSSVAGPSQPANIL
jgi:hypothetical protein